MSIVDELRKLYDLHARGGLTDEEFARAKAALLDGAGGGGVQEQLDDFRLETELARLDREWERERGHRKVSTPAESVLMGVPFFGFGIFWMVVARLLTTIPDDAFRVMHVFAAVGFLMGLGVSVSSYSKAVAYQQAHEAYQRRRASLLAAEKGPQEGEPDLHHPRQAAPPDAFTR